MSTVPGATRVAPGVNGVADLFHSIEDAEVLRGGSVGANDLVCGGNHAFCTTRMHGDASRGVVDEHGLTKPHAFVVATERSPDLGAALQAFVKERLEPYKYPREVVFLDEMPRTHLGKVDRGRLRRSS